MKYLATQESEIGRRAFAEFCADFHASWLDNLNKYCKYHDRDEPNPALAVSRWLKADSHDKVGMPYHGNNRTAQQKNNRTNDAYGRLNPPQGIHGNRHENDYITGQFCNRMRGRENHRFSEQDTDRVNTQHNYNVNDNVSRVTRPDNIRWAEPPQDEPDIKGEEE
ncbi:hypothetical protein HBH56_069670 [Parastagonospora nodorum]|nr:hypothetical protein HBH56_069670 [Parastagonospora nodorum]QRC93603.1 hypothetical protein JI435_038100 [Parastagonospora nodorum SN15]KAH3932619.1 hypothetical protein HBH54_078460 [Parastagonospora nodorum]KAH3988477.1 hypothetical protein HBH51_002020 [Parastagonospora nodorum]KAH4143370.1 hypothetical protein HBH45_033490 [Parastagonospora nodorum]